jgi:parB-like nuclease domain
MAEFVIKTISVGLLDYNRGQLKELPKNPRFFRDDRFDAMKKSISYSPEMLELRELIVFPFSERYIVVCGNLRLRACKELGYKELPCKVLDTNTSVKKLREYATKDNVNFGENDIDIMLNEWDKSELQDWGVEFEQEDKKDEFKERFDSITDETAVYPLIPKYDEKHELFIIISGNEVDSNWLREKLDMQRMKSYKTGKVGKSNVINIKDVRHALQDSNTEP